MSSRREIQMTDRYNKRALYALLNQVRIALDLHDNQFSDIDYQCARAFQNGDDIKSFSEDHAKHTTLFKGQCLELVANVEVLCTFHNTSIPEELYTMLLNGDLMTAIASLTSMIDDHAGQRATAQPPVHPVSMCHRNSFITIADYACVLEGLLDFSDADSILDNLYKLADCATRKYLVICVTNNWYDQAIRAITDGGVPDIPKQLFTCPRCVNSHQAIDDTNCLVFLHLVFISSQGNVEACPPHNQTEQIEEWTTNMVSAYGPGSFVGCGAQLMLVCVPDEHNDRKWVLVETDGKQ